MNKAKIIYALILIILLTSCHRNRFDINTSKIKLNVKIDRFDRELFNSNPDSISTVVDDLYNKYGDFLDIFSYYVINIGRPNQKDYPANLQLFISDKLNREVFRATQKVFPDLKIQEEELTRAFKRYKFYFPEKKVPRVVAYISRFNNPYFTVSNYLGVGLDRYLGPENEYYKQLDLPQYQKNNMFPQKIPSDLMYTWGANEFPFQDSVNNLLANIIYQGQLMLFLDATLPDEPDSLKIGFTRDQMKWVRNNERQMWEYLVEHKLLFTSDPMTIKKLIEPSPFTYYFTNESPGRAGIYIGWQILRRYARKYPDISFPDIMKEKDYEKILRMSKYNP